MADIRFIQRRTRVTIELYPQDVAALITQQEMMCSFTQAQLEKIVADLRSELSTRTEKDSQ